MQDGFLDGIYCGVPPVPEEILSRWNFDPVLLVGLLGLALVVRKEWAGLAAVAVLALVFVSPLCALSSALFSARVVHHVALTAVAAPLLAVWRPARGYGSPALPLLILTAVFWCWHLPALYDAALSNMGLYWAMQATLLGSAVWFWRVVFAPGQTLVQVIASGILLFAQMGLLGALLTFAPEPLYAAHAAAPFSWGFTPLGDQQLGGLIMWVPAAAPVALAAFMAARRVLTRRGVPE